MNIPGELRYTADHEWVRAEGDRLVVGITDFAQQGLGDIVHVELPPVGSVVIAGSPFGEIESTKSVSELYAPASGRVSETNADIEQHPEVVNSDPYGAGWICVVEPHELPALGSLLSAVQYAELLARDPEP